MKIIISSVDFNTNATLNSKIEEKLKKLGQKHNWIQAAEVILKIDHNDKDKDKVIEIRLTVPRNDLYAHKRAEKWELAIRDVFRALDHLIKKQKERDFSHPVTSPLKE